ncbi:helix-turn-helix transcriptional regulator [Mycoplasmatota bacterium]|nr:helix-turn-helix transcriptional regulator [Mycoplasmatota bacterium]
MILADKIMCLRKQRGWSQEELANKMNVSRQSVSKWESESAIPEMDKIVMLSEIFNVSTDYLLKEDMKDDCIEKQEIIQPQKEAVVLRNYEVESYLERVKKNAKLIALGVSLCILGATSLVFLSVIGETTVPSMSEELALSIGLVVLFVLVAIAVALFIKAGSLMKQFEYVESKEVILSGADKQHVNEQKQYYTSKYHFGITFGVVLMILGVLPLIIGSLYDISVYNLILLLTLLMVIVTLAVHIIIRVSIRNDGYETLLNLGEYTKDNKQIEKVTEKIGGVYWPIVVAIYLFWSFYTNDWGTTWIVWPVAGVLFAVVPGISSFLIDKNKD